MGNLTTKSTIEKYIILRATRATTHGLFLGPEATSSVVNATIAKPKMKVEDIERDKMQNITGNRDMLAVPTSALAW